MGTSIDRRPPQQGRALAIYEAALGQVMPALRFGTQLQERSREYDFFFGHGADMVRLVREHRAKLLPLFADANAAALSLFAVSYKRVDRKVASAMVGQLLAGFGAKPDQDVLAAMVDMLQSDEIAIASKLWQPLHVSPAALALACRKLIATAKFVPKAAELHDACREAQHTLQWAYEAADKLLDFVRRCDAVLLAFDHDEWERPYLLPENRPVLQRMLQLHDIHGDGSDACDELMGEYDDDGKYVHPFLRLVQIERAKLLALEAPPERKRVAAAKKRSAMKRSGKPKASKEPKASSEQEAPVS